LAISVFRCEQVIPLDIEETFAFFSDALNLERITPPWLRFRVLQVRPEAMDRGTLIDYRLRLHGLPLRWQSEIVVWQPPYRFVDQQRRGPYKYWHHEHVFESLGDATLVADVVTYETPGGSLVDRLLVRPDLDRIFRFRRLELERWAIARRRERDVAAREQPESSGLHDRTR
jgi:ligand-binding SRPBCC domain-containing protein